MQQVTFWGDTRESTAIRFIREHEPPGGWFGGFSGGKDSCAQYKLAQLAGIKVHWYYCSTGIDPPELVNFIKKYYPDVKFYYPEKSFFAWIQEKGYPTRNHRWCCDKLKKDPSKHLPSKPPRHRLLGMRAEESSRRATRPQIETTRHPNSQIIYKPLFHWLEWEIWDFIDYYEIPVSELYDQNFSRLGCVVCPCICEPTMKIVQRHKDRWPKQYRAFEIAMTKLWKIRSAGNTVRTTAAVSPEEFITAWYKGQTI